jgi:hypothetical protein
MLLLGGLQIIHQKKYYRYRNILMLSIQSNDNDEDYKKLKKYIGIDSDDDTDSTQYSNENKNKKNHMTNYEKILHLCSKANINIYVTQIHKKTKSYEQLLVSCNKKKRDIIKKNVIQLAQYSTKKGYDQLAGTYVIESLTDSMISKLRIIDKLVEMINREQNPKNKNILSLLNIKPKKSIKLDNGIILEEYST